MPTQSRTMALTEACTNIIVGFGLAVMLNYTILPLFGFDISLEHSTEIAVVFTAFALIRSYVLRRVFERIRVNGQVN